MAYYGIHDPVFDIIIDLMNANRKRYCTVAIKTIRKCLGEWHGISISERTVRRHIQTAVDEGLITRQARKKKLENGRIISLPNLYKASGKCMKAFGKSVSRGLRLLGFTGRSQKTSKYPSYDARYSKRGLASANGPRLLNDRTLFVPGSGTIRMV